MNVEDVEKLILLMQRYELNELALKEEKWEFSARRGEKPVAHAPVQYIHTQAPQAAAVLVCRRTSTRTSSTFCATCVCAWRASAACRRT